MQTLSPAPTIDARLAALAAANARRPILSGGMNGFATVLDNALSPRSCKRQAAQMLAYARRNRAVLVGWGRRPGPASCAILAKVADFRRRAALYAAWDAAWDAAWGAAWDAEREWQTARLLEYMQVEPIHET